MWPQLNEEAASEKVKIKGNEKMFNYKILAISGLVLMLGILESAWSQCVQSTDPQSPPPAKYVALVDGTTSCGNVGGQVGCRINGGIGTCSFPDQNNPLFTATSVLASNGSVNWSLTGPIKADVVITGGASQGNACGYFYPNDAVAGKGLGNKKSNGQFSNVTYVDICTDGENEPEPIELPKVQECPEDVKAALLAADADIAVTYKLDKYLGVISSFCVKGGLETPADGISITKCINEPSMATTQSDLPFCTDVLSPDGNPVILTNLNTVNVAGGVGSSCAYTCLPPPMTFDGRTQCAYICK